MGALNATQSRQCAVLRTTRGIPVQHTTRRSTTKHSLIAVTLAAFTMVLLACGPGPTPVTTTASTTTTTGVSTTTTTIAGCDPSYTPSGVTLSDSTASPGDAITVSGNAKPGKQVGLKLVKVPTPGFPSSTVNQGVVATANGAGNWATVLTLPPTLSTGQWNVVATSVDCGGSASAVISIV